MAKLLIFSFVWQMCMATRVCTNQKLVPMLFIPYLGKNINTTSKLKKKFTAPKYVKALVQMQAFKLQKLPCSVHTGRLLLSNSAQINDPIHF